MSALSRKKSAAPDSSISTTPEYRQFIEGLKSRVVAARISSARAVNSELIGLYWDIGCGIVEKQQTLGWGESVVEIVAADLRHAFPGVKGFSLANVWRMRQFYAVFSEKEFLAQAAREFAKSASRRIAQSDAENAPTVAESCRTDGSDNVILAQAVRELAITIPWGHHVLLLGRIKAAPELLYYLQATARFGWSRNVLLNQIKAGAYERFVTDKKAHNFGLALPEHFAEQADEILKSSYNLEFLGIRRAVRERVDLTMKDMKSMKINEWHAPIRLGFIHQTGEFFGLNSSRFYGLFLHGLHALHGEIPPPTAGSKLKGSSDKGCGNVNM